MKNLLKPNVVGSFQKETGELIIDIDAFGKSCVIGKCLETKN